MPFCIVTRLISWARHTVYRQMRESVAMGQSEKWARPHTSCPVHDRGIISKVSINKSLKTCMVLGPRRPRSLMLPLQDCAPIYVAVRMKRCTDTRKRRLNCCMLWTRFEPCNVGQGNKATILWLMPSINKLCRTIVMHSGGGRLAAATIVPV